MKKIWNEKFIEYMNFIINHPNYKGLPIAKKSDGSYTWVAPAKSVIGAKRIDWAKEKIRSRTCTKKMQNILSNTTKKCFLIWWKAY